MAYRAYCGPERNSSSPIHWGRTINQECSVMVHADATSNSAPFFDNPGRPLLHGFLVEDQSDKQHLELHHKLKISTSSYRKPPIYKLSSSIGCPPTLRPPQPPHKHTLALPYVPPARVRQTGKEFVRSRASPRHLQPSIGPPPDCLPPVPALIDTVSFSVSTNRAPKSSAEDTSCDQKLIATDELSASFPSTRPQQVGKCRNSKSSSITRFYDAYLMSPGSSDDVVVRVDPEKFFSDHLESATSVHAATPISTRSNEDCLVLSAKITIPPVDNGAAERKGKESQAEASKFLKNVSQQTRYVSGQNQSNDDRNRHVKYHTRKHARNCTPTFEKPEHIKDGTNVCSSGASDSADRCESPEKPQTMQAHNCVSNLCSLLSSSRPSHVYRLSKIYKIPLRNNRDTDLAPLLSNSALDQEIEMGAIPQVRCSPGSSDADKNLQRASDKLTWTTIHTGDSSRHNTRTPLPSSTLFGLNAFTGTPRIIAESTDDYMSILRRYARATQGECSASISAFLRDTAHVESREDNPHKYYSMRVVDGKIVKIFPGQSLNAVLRLSGRAPILAIEDSSRITGYGFVKQPGAEPLAQ